MKKTFKFGKIAYTSTRKVNAVEVEINLENTDKGPRFSAVGAIWNAPHTDWVAGGQILDHLHDDFKSLRDNPTFAAIHRLWKKWHLNDSHAGTEEQEAAVKKWEAEGNRYDYGKVCDHLKSIDLYEVQVDGKPYKYGHGWLYRAIDAADLAEIESLFNA